MDKIAVSPVISKFRRTLQKIRDVNVSDIHLCAGSSLYIRHKGEIVPISSENRMTVYEIEEIVIHIIKNSHKIIKTDIKEFVTNISDFDCSYSLESVGRFRVNISKQRGSFSIVFRPIPFTNPTFDKLNLPEVIKNIVVVPKGLIIIAGSGSSGKTSTIAAIIDYINLNYGKKILTIEEPIEFLHRNKKSLIIQREIGTDIEKTTDALKSALRQDVDIIVISDVKTKEMLKYIFKTIANGISVICSITSSNSIKVIDQIFSLYPEKEKDYIRELVSENLIAIINQKLIPPFEGENRSLLLEIIRNTENIRNLILENAPYQKFKEEIEKDEIYGMQSFSQHAQELYKKGLIEKQWISRLDNESIFEF